MATAFSQQEREIIIQKLKEAARHYASAVDVRKITVEQLASAADISKGAFYKFYPIKELLFFELLEDMHTEIYAAAEQALRAHIGLPSADCAAESVLAACRAMQASGMMDFLENDVSYILRKIPKEIQQEHYHSDEVHIRDLMKSAGLEPTGGPELASAVVRGLFLTISHRQNIGAQYPQVLDILVRGACARLFP